jgi:hemolysin activation/secretion protein
MPFIKHPAARSGALITRTFLFSLAALIPATGALAAPSFPTPDAGSLLQQIEQNKQPALPHKMIPEKPVEPASMQAHGGVMTVKSFRFVGNTLLGQEKLAPVVAGYLNRPLDFTQLQAAAAAIASAYRDAGWIVRAYLPAQDIIEGVVTIQIVEAVFGGTHIQGEIPRRISREQIMRIFQAQQKEGELLNADKLDRALLLADDLPGVTVAGGLRQGDKAHETDLDLKLGGEPLASGEAGLDNTGARSTGSDRLTVNLRFGSPFKHGDLVSANAMHTEGSDYLRLDGNVPLGSNGWRAGINASHLGYHLVAPEFSAMDAHGISDTLGLEATYPIIRSRLKNLYLSFNADNKRFNNIFSGVTTTRYKSNTLSLGLDGNLFDSLWGGGANSASVSLVDGRLNLNGSLNQAGDAMTTQTAGHYSKLHFALSRQQVITDNVSFFGSLSGQAASKNLDSSEKFYLGGSGGVKAYPSNEGGGAEGKLLNLELRWRLSNGYNLTGFYDYGHLTINPNNHFAGATALNDYCLKGAGLSLAWQSGKGPSVKASYAHRIGDNPNPTATGSDQDGSLFKDRLWLTASFPFSGGGSSSVGKATASREVAVSRVDEAESSKPISAVTLSALAAPQSVRSEPAAPQAVRDEIVASQAVRSEPVEPSAVQPQSVVNPVLSEVKGLIANQNGVSQKSLSPIPAENASGNDSISVSLVSQASKQQMGLINVMVPKNMATTGSSFSFQLPAQMNETATGSKPLRVHGGKPGKWVPYWLKFNQKTRTFTATAVPKGALPAQVVVTINGHSSTIVISERAQ